MERGRPKKPTELKILEGNPGKRPIDINEVKPEKGIPTCPKWLHKYAKQEWNELAEKLKKLGLLTEIDKAAFAGYCQSYARWRESEEFLETVEMVKETESGYLQQSPYVSISHKNLQLMGTYLSKFGLSPSDRAGLVIDKGSEEKGGFEGLLSG